MNRAALATFVEHFKSVPTHTNVRGNKVTRGFHCDVGRDHFDFVLSKYSDSKWFPYTTDQDAEYFGVWYSSEELVMFTYCEGDLILVTCEDDEHFDAELDSMEDYYS